MTISGSLNNALSGLNAAARGAEIVSANVANALTEGYGRRELSLSAVSLGGTGAGVGVDGVTRAVNQATISERRAAQAALGNTKTLANFHTDLAAAIGYPEDAGSLSDSLATFQATLIEAASRPDSETRLSAVANAAKALSDKFNVISDDIQNMRLAADNAIDSQVQALNDGLQKVEILNRDIQQQLMSGKDATALMDQRQTVIDGISDIVPMNEVQRRNGQVALYTPGGAVLLDGRAADISFTPVKVVVPEMTQSSGALSGLSINGKSVSMSENGPLKGGTLTAEFQIRDGLATDAQAHLDALARDMYDRFADPGLDATLSATDPGLFTDNGAGFVTTNEIGLSSRLTFNAAADPDAGGAVWRLRDGLNATAQGAIGDATLLQGFSNTLTNSRAPGSAVLGSTATTTNTLLSEFASLNQGELTRAENERAFRQARFDTLKQVELGEGVDTDAELQHLLLVEQAYTANARVITTIDEMIQTMLGL